MKYALFFLLLPSCTIKYFPYRNYSGFAKATLTDTTGGIHTFQTLKEGAVLRFQKLPNDHEVMCIGATYSVRPSKAIK